MALGTLVLVGGGRMGAAIIAGLIASGEADASAIRVAEPDPARQSALASAHGVRCAADAAELLPGADVVVLAVKPQVIDEVVLALAAHIPASALVVSIAAGISCAHLEGLLAPGAPVVRVMPNTPAMVRQGMAVISAGSAADADDVETVRRMFAALGKAVVLDESLQDAATAISGSGPAYMALVVDALAAAGAEHGLPRDVAQVLAVQTMRGTADLLDGTGQTPAELIAAVSSPGGTTVAALAEFESGGLRETFAAGVAAAVARAGELGGR
ncbi:MAG: pyrroline-5-carboxylate reductase [Coriobacteriaceae bacterium]|nr:pyrroline-5-carboxylate reductase [Coriobacteriaceae bacterium]